MPSRKPPPDPHIWKRDAASLIPDGAIGSVAADLVTVEAGRGFLTLQLATNEDFDPPNELDGTRGVPPRGRITDMAEQAIAARALYEVLARDTLRDWTRREIARRETKTRPGGPLLARALLAAAGVAVSASAKDPAYKAMLRAVQRWAKAEGEHHVTAAGANLTRVNALRGGARKMAADMLAGTEPVIGVSGVWDWFYLNPKTGVVDHDEHFARINTRRDVPEDVQAARVVLTSQGRDFLDTVETVANELTVIDVDLLWVHALHVEVNYA